MHLFLYIYPFIQMLVFLAVKVFLPVAMFVTKTQPMYLFLS